MVYTVSLQDSILSETEIFPERKILGLEVKFFAVRTVLELNI